MATRGFRRPFEPPGRDKASADDAGKSLDQGSRGRWETVFGRDLSDVRVHVGSEADRIASSRSADAYAIGSDIGFRSSAYRPGTIEGEALLAHEIAHVLQRGTESPERHELEADQFDAETDARDTAIRAMAGLVTGRTGVQPRLRGGSGMHFQSCGSEKAAEPPAYLGPESRQTLAEIERITSSGRLLGYFIVLGTVVTTATSSPEENLATGSYDVSPQAQALLALPVITRARVLTEIELLLVSHENDMNEQERAFWHRMHDRVAAINAAGANPPRQRNATQR